jgi:hypothetical protein
VTAGTSFEGTRKPILDWFEAAWRITNAKTGVSARTVSGEMGMSRETGWTWLHKFRRAMVRTGRDWLSGTVGVDETFLGGAEDGVRGRTTIRKAIVVVAVELLPGDRFGRCRLAGVSDASAARLHSFALANVTPGSTLVTDAHQGISGSMRRATPTRC